MRFQFSICLLFVLSTSSAIASANADTHIKHSISSHCSNGQTPKPEIFANFEFVFSKDYVFFSAFDGGDNDTHWCSIDLTINLREDLHYQYDQYGDCKYNYPDTSHFPYFPIAGLLMMRKKSKVVVSDNPYAVKYIYEASRESSITYCGKNSYLILKIEPHSYFQ